MRSTLALLPMLLSALHLSAPAQPVQPGQKFPWQQLEVRAPASPGWVLVSASKQALAFMRRSDELARSEVATVSVFRLPASLDRDGFRAWVDQAVQAELPASRFRPVEQSSEHHEARGDDCVVHRSVPARAMPLPSPPAAPATTARCKPGRATSSMVSWPPRRPAPARTRSPQPPRT